MLTSTIFVVYAVYGFQTCLTYQFSGQRFSWRRNFEDHQGTWFPRRGRNFRLLDLEMWLAVGSTAFWQTPRLKNRNVNRHYLAILLFYLCGITIYTIYSNKYSNKYIYILLYIFVGLLYIPINILSQHPVNPVVDHHIASELRSDASKRETLIALKSQRPCLPTRDAKKSSMSLVKLNVRLFQYQENPCLRKPLSA